MTAKEKAENLVWTFGKCVNDLNMTYEQAKQCALIAVDEMIKNGCSVFYWQEVKNEIERL